MTDTPLKCYPVKWAIERNPFKVIVLQDPHNPDSTGYYLRDGNDYLTRNGVFVYGNPPSSALCPEERAAFDETRLFASVEEAMAALMAAFEKWRAKR